MEALVPGPRPDGRRTSSRRPTCASATSSASVSMTSRGLELHPPTELAPGTATIVRVAVPPAAYRGRDARGARRAGRRARRRACPSCGCSRPSRRRRPSRSSAIRAAGSSARSAAPDCVGRGRRPGAGRRATAGTFDVSDGRQPASSASRCATACRSASTGERDDRDRQRGRRPPSSSWTRATSPAACASCRPQSDRLDLGGAWAFAGGPFARPRGPGAGTATTRVPGHVIYDGARARGRRRDVPADVRRCPRRGPDGPSSSAATAPTGEPRSYVNGSLAGVHGSGATSFDVDLTPFLRPGANDLAITLTEFTPYAVLDDMSWYAHMSLLGIWRDVFLFSSRSSTSASSTSTRTGIPTRATGSLELGVDVINLDPDGRDVSSSTSTIRDGAGRGRPSLEPRAGRSAARAAPGVGSRPEPLGGPARGRPRSPGSTTSRSCCRRTAGPPQAYRRRIGFRRVEVRGNQLLVNGAPIRVRGVNRHDSRILKGRALSADDMREDVVNLRRANVNVIRTSHYPPSPHLLDICDEVGMFVVRAAADLLLGRVRRPPLDAHERGGPADPVPARGDRRDRRPRPGALPRSSSGTSATRAAGAAASTPSWPSSGRWTRRRPTIFSFDLNELGPENELVRKPAAERPDIRSYHYPGWDRTWQEDLAWLGSYDQPVILDEYAPLFAPCLRGPGEGYGLAIDPGIRDYWGAGYQPFMEAALQEQGVHRRADLGRVRRGVRDPARPHDRRGSVGPPAGDRLRPDPRPLPGRARRLPAGRRRLGHLRRLEPAAAGALARPRDVLADRGITAAGFGAAGDRLDAGAGQPVLASVVRGARHPGDGRPRRGRRPS